MPHSLDKTRKRIAKKKGTLGALHEGSRDSRKLHKALVRDSRLEKMASTRRKLHQPMVDRAAYMQEAAREQSRALTIEEFLPVVRGFVDQHKAEMNELEEARRAGRPPSTREDQLKIRTATLEQEFEKGFLSPDLTNPEDVELLEKWSGDWAQLTTVRWIRITSEGVVRPAAFPPNKV